MQFGNKNMVRHRAEGEGIVLVLKTFHPDGPWVTSLQEEKTEWFNGAWMAGSRGRERRNGEREW